MRHALAFEDLLDARLRDTAAPVSEPRLGVQADTAAAYGFFFGSSALSSSIPVNLQAAATWPVVDARFAGAVEAFSGDAQAAGLPRVNAPAAARRRLTGAQRRALLELLDLGATIREDFSATELRSAFRALARRYHPDRHTASSGTERERLARQFARVHDAYRVLAES